MKAIKNPRYPYRIESTGGCLLNCNNAKYDKNLDTYNTFKKISLVLCVILATACIFCIIFTKGWPQVLFSAILGGIGSMLVWIISVHHHDIMDSEISLIELDITRVDALLNYYHNTVYFIAPDESEIKIADPNNVKFRLAKLTQLIVNISAEPVIDSSKMKYKWFDNKEYSATEFVDNFENLMKSDSDQKYELKWFQQILSWNEHYIEDQLMRLKDILQRRKSYILCGDAPVPNDRLENYAKQAESLDKVINKLNKILHLKDDDKETS